MFKVFYSVSQPANFKYSVEPMVHLESLGEDVQIYMFYFLRPPEIIKMRKTCRQMCAVSKLRIVWTNACARYILEKGFPFTTKPLDSMSLSELEQRTCHAYHLASRWLSGLSMPRRTLFIDATSSTSVSDVRFIPGHSGDWILTVSKGIWDMFSIWDVSSSEARKACEWSPRGATFNGLAFNTDPVSEATLAISVLQNDGEHTVQVISLQIDANGSCSLQTIFSIPSSMKPTKLHGDRLAISDDVSQTVVWNWRTKACAILDQSDDETDIWQPNRSIQVVFAHQGVLVVRACSIHLFPEPELCDVPRTYTPIARHSFGWIDGICVAPTRLGTPPALSILLRGESDDPWSSGLHSLDLYTLRPSVTDATAAGYVFPPTLVSKVPAVRGSLRCRNVILGPCGTAAWIQPQDRAVVGLAWAGGEEYPLQAIHPVSGHESLVIAAFPGPLVQAGQGDDGEAVTQSSAIFTNSLNNWTALDYDEEMGRIALCSSFGRVLVLEL
ncbi:hypothetical protein D9615_007816 [Tricholomella constricta]|uniref:F-box domain-containing protein n=1 Tax=Tricholomella constricta TaxID=117010 RepID=A0A8H5M0D8_9AGAR|nr:hypothetical protein D9615_007816 [Tricholomella constricta]